ncbi:MAG TPA: hypothetical protein PLA08_04645 [Candidatus Cloacimonadota bacterium]|nr:hypothetical protein [Candidatus Cloacimonadota bacterium]
MARKIVTMVILISALLTSCSLIRMHRDRSENSYKILSFNPFVLQDYNVVVAENILGEIELILVQQYPPQKYNKDDLVLMKIGKIYNLDLFSIPDSVRFDGIPVPPGSHLDGDYMDLGRFKYNGETITYYDVQTKRLLLPHYFTSDMCANTRTIILIRRKPH